MATPLRSGYGQDTTTDEVIDGVDASGTVALVTGGSGGLGAETGRALAAAGATVILTARDEAKGEAAADAIRTSTGNDRVSVADLELDSLASIRRFAARFLDEHPSLQLLVNNAGVMACPQGTTQDGFERQLGTNHLGHFLLTELLTPALVAGAPARIVNLSSRGHRLSPVDLDDPFFERRDYDKWAAYGQSKTANVLHATELDRRLGERGVRAFAVHPGTILTDLGRHMEPGDLEDLTSRRGPSVRMHIKTVEAGAATSVLAATAPELEGRGGLYLEDCGIADVTGPDAPDGGREYAVAADTAAARWSWSEAQVGS